MDSKFLSYFTADKASDKQSTFELSHFNLFSSKFGGLTPTFWDKVLAKDYYKIAASTQSKGAALSSPTFTELKSNDYAFFCPNQILWKHWNDYFTNGTEFADTYGSNKNNQEINGMFKEPSIPANYLQLIGKIAKGYAVPIYTISTETFFQNALNPNSLPSDKPLLALNRPLSGDIFLPAFVLFQYLYILFPHLRSYFTGIAFIKGYFKVPYETTSRGYKLLLDQISSDTATFQVAGAPLDVLNFLRGFKYTTHDVTQVNIDSKNFKFSSAKTIQTFELFADLKSSRCRLNESPFNLQFYSYSVNIFNTVCNLTDVHYNIRYGIVDDQLIGDLRPSTMISGLSFKDAVFHMRRDPNYFFKNVVQAKTDHDVCILGPDYNFYIDNVVIDCLDDQYFPAIRQSDINSGVVNPLVFSDSVNTNGIGDTPFELPFPMSFYANGSNIDYYSTDYPKYDAAGSPIDSLHETFYSSIGQENKVSSSVFIEHYVYDNFVYDGIKSPLVFDPNANVLGFTQFGFFIYLYQNACKTLDYMGLPVDAFIPRDFKDYARESFTALPFFAYSKIWNEYFRNRTVSSPELDYSETNGSIFQGRCFVNFYNNYPAPTDQPLESYNSWVIPFSCTPKSGITKDLVYVNGTTVINFSNELHYFNLNSLQSVLSLLTGYQLNNVIMNQLVSPYSNTVNKTYLLGFIYDHFVLPNYYNGLLHYRYQNFTKDYFSSALLDPMSGANQEELGQTVSELRTATARQSFWERTAVARSIKKFYEMMVGTSPTHIEYDKPLLLGADHQNVNVSEVIQTSETDKMPLGSRAGIIADYGKGGLVSHYFNEPGILLILHSVTIDAQYMQGLMKKFTPYESYLDYPFTQFAHIGNESIFMRELNYQTNAKTSNNMSKHAPYALLGLKDSYGTTAIPRSSTVNNPIYVHQNRDQVLNTNMVELTDDKLDAVFGYIPRYSSHKFAFDEVHGDFRESMDFWHTFREFHYMPYLSHEFVNYESALRDSNLSRIFAIIDDQDKFWQSVHFYITVKRSIPYYTVPKTSVN